MKKSIVTSGMVLCSALLIVSCGKKESSPDPNPIVVENAKEGTTDWLLTKVHADTCNIDKPYRQTALCRQKDIEGYTSAMSLKAGDSLQVFVSTSPASSFTVDIYRMGYYGGKGGRKMTTLGPFNGTEQPTPEDGDKNLRDCTWKKSFGIKIPDDWTSGVYLGKMTAQTSGNQSYIVFIVKDDRKADFLFQCSDFTWQAYNRWPEWRSLYDWVYENGEHNPWHTTIGAEISFNRPYTFYLNNLPVHEEGLVVGSGEFLLWEFPLAYWLESKGYDVSYISNLDVHINAQELLRAKGFMSVGHDEYWSKQMFDNVAAARDAGVNLLFLSGNAVGGEIGIKPSGSGQPNRVYGRVGKDGHFEQERNLMGATSHGVGFAAFTCVEPDHWVFEGTGMQKGDTIPNLIGWEYHGYELGDIPGLKVLGTGPMYTPTDGKENYATTIYELPGGNFVFNAATCWWNMPLAAPPYFPKTVHPDGHFPGEPINFSKGDERVRKITENLLKRIIDQKAK